MGNWFSSIPRAKLRESREKFDRADSDKDGVLNLYDFSEFVKDVVIPSAEDMKVTMDFLDTDKEDVMSYLEFQHALYMTSFTYVNSDIDGVRCQQIFDLLDTGKSGELRNKCLEDTLRFLYSLDVVVRDAFLDVFTNNDPAPPVNIEFDDFSESIDKIGYDDGLLKVWNTVRPSVRFPSRGISRRGSYFVSAKTAEKRLIQEGGFANLLKNAQKLAPVNNVDPRKLRMEFVLSSPNMTPARKAMINDALALLHEVYCNEMGFVLTGKNPAEYRVEKSNGKDILTDSFASGHVGAWNLLYYENELVACLRMNFRRPSDGKYELDLFVHDQIPSYKDFVAKKRESDMILEFSRFAVSKKFRGNGICNPHARILHFSLELALSYGVMVIFASPIPIFQNMLKSLQLGFKKLSGDFKFEETDSTPSTLYYVIPEDSHSIFENMVKFNLERGSIRLAEISQESLIDSRLFMANRTYSTRSKWSAKKH